MRALHGLALVLAVVFGLPLVAPRARAAACHSSCAQQLADCKRTCAKAATRRSCRETCAERSTCTAPGARIRTLAYVVTECSEDPQNLISARQKLVIRRGNCDPVAVMELRLGAAIPDPLGSLGLCRIYGEGRNGPVSIAVGLFGRLVVLHDGSAVIFEVNNEWSVFPALSPDPPEKGIFFVRADGSGLRKLGSASRFPFVAIGDDPNSPIGVNFSGNGSLTVSPDGHTVVFTDIGPGPDGRDALQIVALDVAGGPLRQITHLPAAPALVQEPLNFPGMCCPRFIDDRTIAFRRTAPSGDMVATYTIRSDGTGLTPPPSVVAVPGGRVVPTFEITGSGGNIETVQFPDTPPVEDYGARVPVQELFLVEGARVLQLTNFGRIDTYGQVMSGGRVLLMASVNPPRTNTNPGGNCQLFSMNRQGGGLRQLTRLSDAGRPEFGCAAFYAGRACSINGFPQDPVTRTIVFGSSCDPVGANPYGFQYFSMGPEGSGLRQLTSARGMTTDSDGTVHVEMPGPSAYSR